MNDQLWIRLEALRASINAYIRRELAAGAFHKSYEGRIEIVFQYPDYFEDPEYQQEPRVTIRAYCSLLFQDRQKDWNGTTFEQALIQAEREIYRLLNLD